MSGRWNYILVALCPVKYVLSANQNTIYCVFSALATAGKKKVCVSKQLNKMEDLIKPKPGFPD